MILTQLNKSSKSQISGRFVSFLLLVILTACGTNPVTISSPARSYPSSTANKPIKSPTAIPSPSPTVLNLNAANITEDAGSLRVQSIAGFQCPAAGTEQWPGQLVLASDRIIYSKDEIQQMLNYFGGNASGTSELPPTLRWVLGGSMDPIPGTAPVAPETPCGATLKLTNTGNTPIQIPKVSVRLEARPQPNPYQYRLIDYCSFLPQGTQCYYPFGGGPECSSYTASIQLGPGEQNDVFSAVPTVIGDSDCGILTLGPSAQDQLTIDFSLTPDTPKSLVYSILPIFTVDTARGEQKLSLSHLISTLAFANVSQFSCYTLQGTTFVLETPTSRRWCR